MLHGAVPADASALSLAGYYINPNSAVRSTSGSYGDVADGPDQVTLTTTGEKLAILFHATLSPNGGNPINDFIGCRLTLDGAVIKGPSLNNVYVQQQWVIGGSYYSVWLTNVGSMSVGNAKASILDGEPECIGTPFVMSLAAGTHTVKAEYGYNLNGGSISSLAVMRRRLFVWRYGL